MYPLLFLCGKIQIVNILRYFSILGILPFSYIRVRIIGNSFILEVNDRKRLCSVPYIQSFQKDRTLSKPSIGVSLLGRFFLCCLIIIMIKFYVIVEEESFRSGGLNNE